MDSWIRRLTPKDTEEIKPNLFVQKKGDRYTLVYPAAWNGKIIWKNFILGGSFWKGFIWFVILMLLAYGFTSSTKACEEFQADPCKHLPNITNYCLGIEDGEQKDTSSLQSFSGEIQGEELRWGND